MVQLRAYPLKTLAALRGFLAREITQSVVLRLCVAALFVVEGWRYDQPETQKEESCNTYPCGPGGTIRTTWCV